MRKKFKDNEIIELSVKDMRCANCEVSVKGALRKVEGVHRVKVNRRKKKVFVSVDPGSAVRSEELIEALEQIGYRAEAI